ncbi:MAG: hypothetical protein KAZ30_02585 [Candidatus Magasanikbacteria bacterium]|nr:hypothetical protein [Candidatus Magasanikbacteria bacterium]
METHHFQLPEQITSMESVVDKKYSEHEKQLGEMCLLHEISSLDHISEILKSGFLLSTHEREALGLHVKGKSSEKDKRTGGASNVFARVAIQRPHDPQFRSLKAGVYFILDSALLDRKDWYGYTEDSYGRTAETKINHTVFLKTLAQHKKHFEENEVMFPNSVDLTHLDSIVISYEKFVLFIEQWVDMLSCSFGTKMQLMASILRENPEDDEAIKHLFEELEVPQMDQENFFVGSPKNLVSKKIQGGKDVRYVRTWEDCVDLSHGREPQLHPKISSFASVFLEISDLIAAHNPQGGVSRKTYRSLANLLARGAEGTLSEKPEFVLEKIKSLLT